MDQEVIKKYILEGVEIGLSTERGNLDEIVNEINLLRKAYDQDPVTNVIEFDSPMAAIKAHSKDGISLSNAFYGQFDTHWLQSAVAKAKEETLDIPEEKYIHLYNLAKMVGWFWLSDDTAIITHKPTEIHMTPRKSSSFITGEIGVLHNPNGLAIKYADGEGVYAIGGIQLSKDMEWIVTEPEKLTPGNILGIKNTDLKSEVIKMMGAGGIVDLVEHTVLDEDSFVSYHSPNSNVMIPPVAGLEQFYKDNYIKKVSNYKLLELYIEDNRRVYLEMTCPSKGERHVEGVPPTIKTVADALNHKEGQPLGAKYVPPMVRT